MGGDSRACLTIFQPPRDGTGIARQRAGFPERDRSARSLLRRADRSRTRRSVFRTRSVERRRPRRSIDAAYEYVFMKNREWGMGIGAIAHPHSPFPTPTAYEHRHYSLP